MTWRSALRTLWDPTAELRDTVAPRVIDPPLPDAAWAHLARLLSKRLGSPYAGDFRQQRPGPGTDLRHLREYQPGDDTRALDWPSLARTGRLHIRERYDERQLPLWLFIDLSSTMQFGQTAPKVDFALRLAELIGQLATQAGHRAGLILWDGHGEPRFFAPRTGRAYWPWLMRHANPASSTRTPSETPPVFPDWSARLRQRSLVILLSDFLFLESAPMAPSVLAHLAHRHPLEALLLLDPIEVDGPSGSGPLPLSDGRQTDLWWHTGNTKQRDAYQAAATQDVAHRVAQLNRVARVSTLRTDEDAVQALRRFIQPGAGVRR